MSKEGRYLNAVLDEPREGSLTPRRRSVCFLGLSVHPLAVALKRQAGPKENGPAVASATCDPPSGTQDARAQGVAVQGVNRGKGTGFYPRGSPPLWNISCFPPLFLKTLGKWEAHSDFLADACLTVVGISQGFRPLSCWVHSEGRHSSSKSPSTSLLFLMWLTSPSASHSFCI